MEHVKSGSSNVFITDKVVDRLVDNLTKLKNNKLNKINQYDILLEMQNIIKNRFGISVDLDFGNSTFVMLYSNTDNIFLPNLKTSKPLLDVIVDPNKLYIKNLNINFIIKIDKDFFNNPNITPRMIAGALLHEIGHIYYSVYYMYRIAKNNSILLESLNLYKKNKTKEAVHIVYKQLDKKDKVTYKEAIDNISKQVIEDTRALYSLGSNISHDADFERLADNFAVKFGLGSDLAILLKELTYPSDILNTEITQFILKLILLLIAQVTLNFRISYPFVLVMGIMNILINILEIYGVNTYEDLPNRLKSMKLNAIKIMRDNKLPNESKAALIDTIKDIDKTMKEVSNKNKFKVLHILYKLDPYLKNNFDSQLKEEKILEVLNYNDLHYIKDEVLLGFEALDIDSGNLIFHQDFYFEDYSSLNHILQNDSKTMDAINDELEKYEIKIEPLGEEKYTFYSKNKVKVSTGMTTISFIPKDENKKEIITLTTDAIKVLWGLINKYINIYEIKTFKYKGKCIYLTIQEKLSYDPCKNFNIELVSKILIDTNKKIYVEYGTLSLEKELDILIDEFTKNKVNKIFIEQVKLIKQFKDKYNIKLGNNSIDLHSGNIMYSKDYPIIIDPIYDQKSVSLNSRNCLKLPLDKITKRK